MNSKINTGIIGFGLSGRVFHAPFIHTHPGFELSAIVERHQQNSRKIYPEISILRNHQELLDDEQIELVVVATPNKYHLPMAHECLLAGKDVIIEKPLTPSHEEADELIKIAKQEGRQIFVFQNRRWDADFLTIKKLISEGNLGEINYYEVHFDRYSPQLKTDSWRDENIPGGGILYDLGSHLIDQALVLFGMPDEIKAELKAERNDSPVDDYFRLEMFYPGKHIVLTAGMMVKEIGPRFTMHGSKASFVKHGIDPQEAMLKAGNMPNTNNWGQEDENNYGILIPLDNKQKEKIIISEKGNYMGFFDNVYNVLRKKALPSVLSEQARNTIFIIQKAFESSRTQKLIKLK